MPVGSLRGAFNASFLPTTAHLSRCLCRSRSWRQIKASISSRAGGYGRTAVGGHASDGIRRPTSRSYGDEEDERGDDGRVAGRMGDALACASVVYYFDGCRALQDAG